MKPIGVVRFPGTNCDRDVQQWLSVGDRKGEYLWHLNEFDINSYEALVLPGGFSYGDYLRAGALAARSPVMRSVREFAAKGGPVLGICNGFQILVEARLLPGALVRNEGLRFIDEWVDLEPVSKRGYWSKKLTAKMRLPIAHGEGRFYANENELKTLEDHGQIWLRYQTNLTGSRGGVAGLLNEAGNVAGLMPHPERAIFDWMGGVDGLAFI